MFRSEDSGLPNKMHGFGDVLACKLVLGKDLASGCTLSLRQILVWETLTCEIAVRL